MADTSATRFARLTGLRDAMMADNLLDIAAREARRGPTLVFAHNRHLQKHPSFWQL
ncbi:MAG: erythromycin esterase family protein, partial [Mycobacterium sp.]